MKKTLSGCWLALLLVTNPAPAVELSSPDGRCRVQFDNGKYQLFVSGKPVTLEANMGITVDGAKLGGCSILKEVKESVSEDVFATRGNHREARIPYNELTLTLHDPASGRQWHVVMRMANGCFAWRYIVPAKEGTRSVHVDGEQSSFAADGGSGVWFSERNNDWKLKSYGNTWKRGLWKDLATISSQGPVQCPPLVVESGTGWLLFTEAALVDYSGMRLSAGADGEVTADFSEGEKGFEIAGDRLVTPWRVVRYAGTLTELVNTADFLEWLNPPPDEKLFADSDGWLKGGRATWHWWSQQRAGSPEEETRMVDCAAKLGYEYNLVDEGWTQWKNAWVEVKKLCDYARERNVRILLWRDMKDTQNPANDYADLRAYLDKLAAAGVAGLKLDFFNAENKAKIDYQRVIFREAAERKLLVVLHGCQKPSGETRTWPNNITREAVAGLEFNRFNEGSMKAEHNCALPFTRMAIGAADYTPLGFSHPGPTTWAHQLATPVVFLSPLLVVAEYPPMLVDDPRLAPALDIIKALPTEWDETLALAPSKIGECAAFARRKGNEWWVGIINAPAMKIEALELSFLGEGTWQAVRIDGTSDGKGLQRAELKDLRADSKLAFDLKKADGAVLRFSKQP